MSTNDKIINLEDGTTINKTADGRFIVESWGTAQVRDSEGQELPVHELIEDVPNMMKYNPQIHLSHTDTPLGPILDIKMENKETKKGMKPALRVKYEILGGRRYLESAKKGVEKGIYKQVSLKGYAFGDSTYRSDDDGLTEIPHDIEMISFALCGKGMNPEADHITINGKSIKKENTDALMNESNFNEVVVKLLFDGLPYSRAIDTAKNIFVGGMAKELIKEDEVVMEIHKNGDKWTVTNKDGNDILGTHDTKESALNQLVTIEADKKVNKGVTTIPNTDDNSFLKGDAPMATLEEIQKELDTLKEQYGTLEKENAELKEKINKENTEPETPSDEDTKEVKKENVEPEKTIISKEDIPEEIIKEISKSVRAELVKDKDSLLDALGLTKYEPNQNADNLSELVKKADDGTMRFDPVKLHEMVKEGEERSRNSHLEDIPDIEKSLKDIYG